MKKVLTLFFFYMLYTSAGFAATKVWNGAAGDKDWTNPVNWQTGAATPVTPTAPPGSGDVARFDVNSGTDTVTSASAKIILKLVIRDGANITFDMDLTVGGNLINDFAVIGYGVGGTIAFIGTHTYHFRSDVDNNNQGTITSNNPSPLHITFGPGTTVQFTSNGSTPTVTNAFKMHEGSVVNYGTLSIASGYNLKALQLQSGATFFNSGYINMGNRQIQTQAGSMFTNDVCAVITNTNFMAVNGTSFVNNGYINKGTTSTNSGTPTNNGFYTGPWTGVNNVPSTGIDLFSNGGFCSSAPIYAVDTSGTGYTWESGGILYGTNTAAGLPLNPALIEGGSITINPVGCSAVEYAGLSVTITCMAPLPVKLSHFRVVAQDDRIRLDWQTESEKNHAGFFVERMEKGDAIFEVLDWIDRNGQTAGPHTYSFIDSQVFANKHYYYRLQQVDLDGKIGYSNIESAFIDTDNISRILLYPNPAKDFVIIDLLQQKDISSLKVFNMMGKLMPLQIEQVNETQRKISTISLPEGAYFITCFTSQGERIKKQFFLLK